MINPSSESQPRMAPLPRKQFIFSWKNLIDATNEALVDLRPRWARGVFWCFAFIWFLGICSALLMMSLLLPWSPELWQPEKSLCQPDGSASYDGDRYNLWQIGGFFQITVKGGSLSFTQAKVIDIACDIIIGRVGQTFLAYFSWKAISVYIKSCMHQDPVTYATYWTVFIERQPTITSTIQLIRDFATRQGLRSKAAMTFIVMAMVYVLAFPTIASAMTGYALENGSFVQDLDGNLIPTANFTAIQYIIHDGERVNLTNDYQVLCPHAGEGQHNGCNLLRIVRYREYAYPGEYRDSLFYATTQYALKYGFFGLDETGGVNDKETTWMNQTIPKPALSISAFYLPMRRLSSIWKQDNWVDPRTGATPFADLSNAQFAIVGDNKTNRMYSWDYLEQQTSCQPVGAYQWGFSYLQLFLSLLMLLVWTTGVFTLWLRGHLELAQHGEHEMPGKLKAALNLVHSVNEEFLASSEKPPIDISSRQLENDTETRLNGGRIRLRALDQRESINVKSYVMDWARREKWWLVALMAMTLLSLPGLYYLLWEEYWEWVKVFVILGYTLFMVGILSIVFMLSAGGARRSRTFVVIAGGAFGLVLAGIAAPITWHMVELAHADNSHDHLQLGSYR
ncbi:hypothetical protein B0T19DRAFT_487913 [Cercophora scortea]|uniref:Uncharacterized protein n=1 Tax=Cercophora scortea TaxID=314031 RepID=A0AAE0I6Q2_9PEZI|nr:hypothetical protein B0T19DRAFT_487913 [Cercophora scortea]